VAVSDPENTSPPANGAREFSNAISSVPPPGIGYIVAYGSTKFSAQSDSSQARQVVNLLYQTGVPPTRVRAFLPEEAGTVTKPSPHVGLPTLEIPTDYSSHPGCINCSPAKIYCGVAEAIALFATDPPIAGIVFVYFDHGDATPLRFPDRLATPLDMGILCTNARKPFLVVLDARCSATFAQNVIKELKAVHIRCDVGFLTADGDIATSAVLISRKNPELMCTCDTDGIKLQYKINHSMFGRAWLLDVTYKLAADDPTLLEDFPARLNVAGEPMKRGYESSFWSYGPTVAKLPIRFFFPWAPINPVAKSLVNRSATFADIIPDAEIGSLFDDITHFCDGPGSDSGYKYSFRELSVEAANLIVGEPGVLSKTDPFEKMIRDQLKDCRRDLPPKIPVEHPTYVPIDDIAEIVVDELEKAREGRPLLLGEDRQWLEDLRQFVVDLIGPLPFGMGCYVWLIYSVSVHEDKDTCRELIRSARDAVAKDLGITLENDSK
jgi:hypothetical protein